MNNSLFQYTHITRKILLEKYQVKKNNYIIKLQQITTNNRINKKNETSQPTPLLKSIMTDILFTKQKPKIVTAKKSIAAFKLKKKDQISSVVSLPNKYLHELMETCIEKQIEHSRAKPITITKNKSISLTIPKIATLPFIEKFQTILSNKTGIQVTMVFSKNDPYQINTYLQILQLNTKIKKQNNNNNNN